MNNANFFKIFHRKKRPPILGPYTFCRFLGHEFAAFTSTDEFHWMAYYGHSAIIPRELCIHKNKYPRIYKRIKKYLDCFCILKEVKWKKNIYKVYYLSFDE